MTHRSRRRAAVLAALASALAAMWFAPSVRAQSAKVGAPVRGNCTPFGAREPHIIGCTLTADDTVFGRMMPAGSLLHFDSTGRYKYFEFRAPASYDGYFLAGGGDGPHHSVYPDGAPKIFWFDRIQEVHGVPCRPMRIWTEIVRRSSAVHFHPNGKLQACRAGRTVTVQGVAFGKGDRITFDADGKVIIAR